MSDDTMTPTLPADAPLNASQREGLAAAYFDAHMATCSNRAEFAQLAGRLAAMRDDELLATFREAATRGDPPANELLARLGLSARCVWLALGPVSGTAGEFRCVVIPITQSLVDRLTTDFESVRGLVDFGALHLDYQGEHAVALPVSQRTPIHNCELVIDAAGSLHFQFERDGPGRLNARLQTSRVNLEVLTHYMCAALIREDEFICVGCEPDEAAEAMMLALADGVEKAADWARERLN